MAFISSDKARRYIRSLPVSPRVDFAKLYPDADPSAIDLIDTMLAFDPSNRITVEEALSHPYLASLHDVDDEPSASEPFAFGARSRLFPIRPRSRLGRRSLRTASPAVVSSFCRSSPARSFRRRGVVRLTGETRD